MKTDHIPWQNYKAIIFDMDGVIIDSESIWPKKQPKMIQSLLPNFPASEGKQFMGQSALGVYKILQTYGLKISQEEFLKQLDQFALKEIYSQATIFPSTLSLIQTLSETHTLSLASSALHSWISASFRKHDLRQYFTTVISSEDVGGASKPEPDVFVKAAESLNLLSSECLVIEDSINGLHAAHNAGMDMVVFKSHSNRDRDIEEECDFDFFVLESD